MLRSLLIFWRFGLRRLSGPATVLLLVKIMYCTVTVSEWRLQLSTQRKETQSVKSSYQQNKLNILYILCYLDIFSNSPEPAVMSNFCYTFLKINISTDQTEKKANVQTYNTISPVSPVSVPLGELLKLYRRYFATFLH